MNMRCICGAVLPIDNRGSICESCLQDEGEFDGEEEYDNTLEQQELEDFEQADEYFGQREDYGDWGYEGCHEE